MKYVFTLLLAVALLTGCADKQYEMSAVKVVDKSEQEYACRGTCHSYYVSIEKDGNLYTYSTDAASFKLVSKGSTVDLVYYKDGMNSSGGYVTLAPVGVQKAVQ
jgi:hypothetical protein